MHARENPFRVERLHGLRYRFDRAGGDDFDALWARLCAAGGRGAIVGPHGTGKTTLLGELGARLRARGHRVRALRIGAGTRALARGERERLLLNLEWNDAVLLDGAGHLLPWVWWRVRHGARHAGIFVVTAHRPGRLPTLLRTASSPALLAALADELHAPIDGDDATRLLRDAAGNVRDALRALYDAHADRSIVARRA